MANTGAPILATGSDHKTETSSQTEELMNPEMC
jgi:hypothetical protein